MSVFAFQAELCPVLWLMHVCCSPALHICKHMM